MLNGNCRWYWVGKEEGEMNAHIVVVGKHLYCVLLLHFWLWLLPWWLSTHICWLLWAKQLLLIYFIGILILILSTLLFGKLRVSFAVAEILLLIGLSVESGHLKNWEIAKESCLVVGQGLFSAAGVFGILSTDSFLGGWFIHDSTKSTKTIASSRKYKC